MSDIIVEDIPNSDKIKRDDSSQTSLPGREGLTHRVLAERFNLDAPTPQEDKKLKEIWDHVSKLSESGEMGDIIWQTMHLEQTIGAPALGETRLDKLYRYVKLRRQERQLQDELREISSNGQRKYYY